MLAKTMDMKRATFKGGAHLRYNKELTSGLPIIKSTSKRGDFSGIYALGCAKQTDCRCR